MAKFSCDFDIDGIMQSIEEELAEIVQSELESEENYMFQKLPSNSQKLLDDIVAADNPVQMLQSRFEKCSKREDAELRGIMRELREKGYIETQWGSNVPTQIIINNSARTYHEQLDEYERTLQAQSSLTNNYIFNNANGNFVFGDVTGSTLSVDNSIQQIERAIEEQGGEDKEDLMELLEEVKELVENIESSRSIPKQKKLFQRLTDHMSKHGWFYGAVIQLLGTAAMTILGS